MEFINKIVIKISLWQSATSLKAFFLQQPRHRLNTHLFPCREKENIIKCSSSSSCLHLLLLLISLVSAHLRVPTLLTFNVLCYRQKEEKSVWKIQGKGIWHAANKLKVLSQTHVCAQDRSSCLGFWISSSACFWRECQLLHLSPPAPSSDTPSSSPRSSDCYRLLQDPLVCNKKDGRGFDTDLI